MNTKKTKKIGLALLIASAGLLAYGTATGQVIAVPLEAAPAFAGHIGQAILKDRGSETSVNLYYSGAPDNAALPLHLYAYIYPGSCESPGAQPAYELNRIVTTQHDFFGDTTGLSRTAPVSMDELRSGDYSIVLRSSPADGNQDLFCGEIR
ncbi:hypothetical protein D3C76_1053380 [compost metagenome]|uniref:Uncharacterized protein n=1 Tax=Pseudomonas jinjuensis TaxID=198616 RepID=A0A1H0M9V8_9PSED|nr:hypothetical protein [Pseudomonas jinjuensis]SDO77184.1 hypothetical protein SAMN05216193_115153 [Pseudomonas jinjuensis]